MSIERSHDRKRLQLARTRQIAAPKADASGSAGDGRGPFRRTRRQLTATLRARVAAGVGSALGAAATPQDGAQIARTALSLYRAGVRELRTSSPIALSHLLRWAIGTATAQHLALAAADAGPPTERGRQLLELSMRLEGRAERASVAALTMAQALSGQHTARARNPLHAAILGDDDGGES